MRSKKAQCSRTNVRWFVFNGVSVGACRDPGSRVVYQFIVLSVAKATGAAFEWRDHVQHALDAGLPRSLIDGIAEGSIRSLPHPYELLRDILSKALAWQPIPDALQAQAVAEWGKDGLVEIVVIFGFYQMFAAINQGFDIVRSVSPANSPNTGGAP
jgi:hypothetical protein